MSRNISRWCTVSVVSAIIALAPSLSIADTTPKKKPKAPPPVDVKATGGPVAVLWAWSPSTVTIPAGGRIRWTNDSTAPHTVTAYSSNWDTREAVAEGSSVVLRFSEPGTYRYYCDVIGHGFVAGDQCLGMCGTVVVE